MPLSSYSQSRIFGFPAFCLKTREATSLSFSSPVGKIKVQFSEYIHASLEFLSTRFIEPTNERHESTKPKVSTET